MRYVKIILIFLFMMLSQEYPVKEHKEHPEVRINKVEVGHLYTEMEPIRMFLPTENDWYKYHPEERTEKIYKTLCRISGWWGTGCPEEREIVTWLLFEEGSILNYEDKIRMVKGIRYKFHRFDNFMVQLSGYTAFYNPNSGRELDGDDWMSLRRRPPQEYFDIVEKVYEEEIRHTDGTYLFWWHENEIAVPESKWGGKRGIDYIVIGLLDGSNFYFTGIPNIRNCAMRSICN